MNPDVAQSKRFKLIKESSDVGQELNSNGSNVFFSISSINLVADTLGYIQSPEQFDLMLNQQKLFTNNFDYFDVDEKSVKKSSIYTPYKHLQSGGFTFKHLTNKETYNVKLNSKDGSS